MVLSEVRAAMCRIIASGIDIKTIQSMQGLPRSLESFCTVWVPESFSDGWDEITFDGDNEVETVSGRRRMMVSVNFYLTQNGGTLDYAENLKMYLQSSRGQEAMITNGLGLLSFSPVRDLTAVEKGAFESRSQLDIMISVITEFSSKVRKIEEVAITGDFQSSDSIPVEVSAVQP